MKGKNISAERLNKFFFKFNDLETETNKEMAYCLHNLPNIEQVAHMEKLQAKYNALFNMIVTLGLHDSYRKWCDEYIVSMINKSFPQ